MAKTARKAESSEARSSGSPAWQPVVPPGLQHLVDQGLVRPPTRPWLGLGDPPKLSMPLPLTSTEILDFDRGP